MRVCLFFSFFDKASCTDDQRVLSLEVGDSQCSFTVFILEH